MLRLCLRIKHPWGTKIPMQEETIIYVFLSIFFLSVCFFSDRLGYFILISLLPAAEGQTRRLLVMSNRQRLEVKPRPSTKPLGSQPPCAP